LFNFEGYPLGLPAQLPPGGVMSFHFNPPDVSKPLAEEGVGGEGTRAYVQTGHGRFRGNRFHLGEMLKPLRPYYSLGKSVPAKR